MLAKWTPIEQNLNKNLMKSKIKMHYYTNNLSPILIFSKNSRPNEKMKLSLEVTFTQWLATFNWKQILIMIAVKETYRSYPMSLMGSCLNLIKFINALRIEALKTWFRSHRVWEYIVPKTMSLRNWCRLK